MISNKTPQTDFKVYSKSTQSSLKVYFRVILDAFQSNFVGQSLNLSRKRESMQ
jgi:hypothetical protein